LEEHRQRMAENPERMADRAEAVEHPFGTLKRRCGWDHFLLRGLEKVRGEWSLMALGYNFTRVLNLIGIDRFTAYCLARNTCPPSPSPNGSAKEGKGRCWVFMQGVIARSRRVLVALLFIHKKTAPFFWQQSGLPAPPFRLAW